MDARVGATVCEKPVHRARARLHIPVPADRRGVHSVLRALLPNRTNRHIVYRCRLLNAVCNRCKCPYRRAVLSKSRSPVCTGNINSCPPVIGGARARSSYSDSFDSRKLHSFRKINCTGVILVIIVLNYVINFDEIVHVRAISFLYSKV